MIFEFFAFILWGSAGLGFVILVCALGTAVMWDMTDAFRRWRRGPPPPPRIRTSEEIRADLNAYEADCCRHGVEPYGRWS